MTPPVIEILNKAVREEPLSREEILSLLALKDQEKQERLFKIARRLRDRYFGDKTFLYGFVYFSTWCRNNCAFCYYRASNRLCERYRKTEDQVIDAAIELAESGVHLLDLTMGEDPSYYDKENGFQPLFDLVRKIKNKTGLPIMISWGVISLPIQADNILDKYVGPQARCNPTGMKQSPNELTTEYNSSNHLVIIGFPFQVSATSRGGTQYIFRLASSNISY